MKPPLPPSLRIPGKAETMEHPVGKGTRRGWDGLWGQGGAAWAGPGVLMGATVREPHSMSHRAGLFPPTPPALGMLPWESGSGGTWDTQNCSPKQGEPEGKGRGHLKHSQLLHPHAWIFGSLREG